MIGSAVLKPGQLSISKMSFALHWIDNQNLVTKLANTTQVTKKEKVWLIPYYTNLIKTLV